jgi:quinol monooxygenase YgiN
MHAALVSVRVDPEAREAAMRILREQIVPMVASEPGFVAGYWLEPENDVGHGVIVFETEEQARATAPPVGPAPAPGATVESVEFRAVVASA